MASPWSASTMWVEAFDMTTPTFESSSATRGLPGRVCTIRDRTLARVVLAALVVFAVVGGAWLSSLMIGGPYLADSLLVEAFVAGTVVFAGVALAVSLNRALGCGHCHTSDCTCS
jgi:hypothetical protein